MLETIFFNPYIWIGLAITGLALLVMVLMFIFWYLNRNMWDSGEGWAIGGFSALLIALCFGVPHFSAVLVPYDSSYYYTYKITGEVTEMEAAFSDGEGVMSQVFISKVDGIDLYIRSDDQRFRTIDVGDEANFVCSKNFAYFQESWYDCSLAG